MNRALRRATDAVTLDAAEAEVLLHARGADLDRLCEAAGRVRDAGLAAAGRPGVITYSRKVFIPLTRLCRDRCHYCTFATVPGKLRRAGQRAYLSPDEVLAIARAGPTALENRAVHALARILLHGRIRNIQTSWVKLARRSVLEVLHGGVNDLGGTLMEETISRMAGSGQGSHKSITDLEALAHEAGRPARQRTTTYGAVAPEREAVARAHDGLWRSSPLPVLSQR